MENEDYDYGNEKAHSRTFKNGTRKSFRDKIRFQNKSNDGSTINIETETVKQKWSGKYQNGSEEEEDEENTINNNNGEKEESEEENRERDFREKKKNKRELRKEKKELKNRDK